MCKPSLLLALLMGFSLLLGACSPSGTGTGGTGTGGGAMKDSGKSGASPTPKTSPTTSPTTSP